MPLERSPALRLNRRGRGSLLISWMDTTDGGHHSVVAPAWGGMVGVGRVARAHGRRGEVVVNPETDFPEQRFRRGGRVYVNVGETVRELRIVHARFQSGRPVVALEGFTTISEAERLAGCELRIPESEQQPLPADVYYERSLVECEVRTVDDVSVGKVIAVRGVPGANRLLVQSRDPQDEAEIEIPLVDSICVSVDLEQNVVVVDPPVGLLELNRRGV